MILLLGLSSFSQNIANSAYPFDPATVLQKGVTAGEIIERQFTDSKIYPGTQRSYWIYVPAGYTPEKPACLYVCMDGIQYNAPTVFDNLIATGEMPMTIGVFVGSGRVLNSKGEVVRFNRSNEFDKTDDTFVRFLTEELLPDVEKQQAKDGRFIRFSNDGNNRAIAGASSGAICAFTAAWQRPDLFSRVFSAIGTYVAMRGGNEYPVLIRKTKPKPLRIYLEDGVNDVWNPIFGHWFEANQLMESALNFAGYEVTHSWGRGAHDGNHATRIFPDAMRWLWRGWPEKVKSGVSLNDMLTTILLKDSEWKRLKTEVLVAGDLFTDGAGNIVFQSTLGSIWKSDSVGNIISTVPVQDHQKLIGTGPEEYYLLTSNGTIIRKESKTEKNIARGFQSAKCLLKTSDENLYITQESGGGSTKIWLIRKDGTRRLVNQVSNGGTQLAIYPNHSMLFQTEKHSDWIYSAVIDNDSLKEFQRFYWLHNSENFNFEEPGRMVFDERGNLFVATIMGIQVCDQNGRVRAMLTLPSGKISSIAFGGKNRDFLFALSDGKLFCIKLNVHGKESWHYPLNPVPQGAG